MAEKRITATPPRKLIIFNGPPRSGKDTAAHAVWRMVENAKIIRMSAPLKDGLRTIFDLSDEEAAWLEENKGATSGILGTSWRNAQISLSEGYMKQAYGPDIFGQIFARKLRKTVGADVIINSDAGFTLEWTEPLRIIKPINALLVKIHRPGFDYAGDSRNYIELPNVRTVWVHNTGEKRAFEDNVLAVVRAWLSL